MRRTLLVGLLLVALVGACARPATMPTPVASEAGSEVVRSRPTPIHKSAGRAGEMIDLPEVNPLEVTGDIIAAGSSTVYPLSERMAERFKDEGYGYNITIDSIGSGAGFERFCTAGESDISNASRPVKEKERANCAEIGREPIEIRVGTDALAVVVSRENDFLIGVTMDELASIFSSDAVAWSDVNPDWPDKEILRFIPGTDSGTFDFFVEEVFDEDKARALSAANQQLSEDDNVLARGVLGSRYAVGYFGYAYYAESMDVLRALAVDGVEPTEESVNEGLYPLSRPLLMYTSPEILVNKPQVAAFINFYLTFVDEEVGDIGYFPANSADLNAAKRAWLDAVGEEQSVEVADQS